MHSSRHPTQMQQADRVPVHIRVRRIAQVGLHAFQRRAGQKSVAAARASRPYPTPRLTVSRLEVRHRARELEEESWDSLYHMNTWGPLLQLASDMLPMRWREFAATATVAVSRTSVPMAR